MIDRRIVFSDSLKKYLFFFIFWNFLAFNHIFNSGYFACVDQSPLSIITYSVLIALSLFLFITYLLHLLYRRNPTVVLLAVSITLCYALAQLSQLKNAQIKKLL